MSSYNELVLNLYYKVEQIKFFERVKLFMII